jgi:hypothetical protein
VETSVEVPQGKNFGVIQFIKLKKMLGVIKFVGKSYRFYFLK